MDNGQTVERSNKAEVRNPVLALPGAAALLNLDTVSRVALIAVLSDIRTDSAERAAECWRRHKAPMAAYWKAVSVYTGHIVKVLRRAQVTPNHTGDQHDQ